MLAHPYRCRPCRKREQTAVAGRDSNRGLAGPRQVGSPRASAAWIDPGPRLVRRPSEGGGHHAPGSSGGEAFAQAEHLCPGPGSASPPTSIGGGHRAPGCSRCEADSGRACGPGHLRTGPLIHPGRTSPITPDWAQDAQGQASQAKPKAGVGQEPGASAGCTRRGPAEFCAGAPSGRRRSRQEASQARAWLRPRAYLSSPTSVFGIGAAADPAEPVGVRR